MGTALDLADVQGNILNGYGSDFRQAVHLLLHADTAEAARQCLRQVEGRVTRAARRPRRDRPRTTLNVGVTYNGFERLGLRRSLLSRFPEAFRQGPAKRAADLGDTGLSHPAEWEEPLGTGDVHLLLTVYAQSPDDLC